ncbi:MAG: hypothetical protein DMG67_00240 [Acidobacteria bacterium]|nr:MAG: hypothetical protein DMG67_00240 [Acidobacteriota bacterium]
MKAKWYGDQSDLVKWSVLLHLAKAHKLHTIVQICFLNHYDFPSISIDGEKFQVPREVIQHFRTISSVQNISKDVRIFVFEEAFYNRDPEVTRFWSHLLPEDILVLYQHQTNRNGKPWIEEKQQQLAKAINVDLSQVKIARSEEMASGVVFLFCRKP